jgi:hypothetical protein
MSFEADRTVLEIRELLAKTRNRDAVVRLMSGRGMPPEEAHGLVYSIHKANLSANRKSSFWLMMSGGTGIIISLLAILMTSGQATSRSARARAIVILVIGIPAVGSLLWGFASFVMASGYEVDED